MKLFKWRSESKKLIFHNRKRNTINEVIEKLEESEKNVQKEHSENMFESSIRERLENYHLLVGDLTLNKEQSEIKQSSKGEPVRLTGNLLCLKEYMVNINNQGSSEYVNLLSSDLGPDFRLSSNNSEDYKFYSFDYNGGESKDFSNIELECENNVESSKLMMKNTKFKNIIVDFPSKFKNISGNISKSISYKKNSRSSSLSNVGTPNIVNENHSEESDMELSLLFQKIRKLMGEKYEEYKTLLEEVSYWEENGCKNGIKFLRRKDNNNCSYTTIRGIIDIDLNKENDLFYESISKKKIPYIKNRYHLNDLITSKGLVNYIWDTDPLSYDNTVDKSNRVYTWNDENPGFCIYYHSYKGALGVQGRDFVLVGYKDNINSGQVSSCELSNLASLSSASPSRHTSPNSNPVNNIRMIVNNISPSRLKKWSKKSKKSTPDSNNNHPVLNKDFNSSKSDSAFFISSDLSKELDNDNKFHSMIKNVYNPSFIRAKCYLNGVRVEKLQSNDANTTLRMDILWIGDLNGKLPEFLKRTLLSSSLSTMKVLKDKFIESKKKELFNMITNN